MSVVTLSLEEVYDLAHSVLLIHGAAPAHAGAIARSLTKAEADACHSHGLYRLIGYVASLNSGKADPAAEPLLTRLAPAVLRVDAQRAFAPLAIEVGRAALLEAARAGGVALLAINNCYHLSALWADVDDLAEAGLVAWAFTIGQCCVAPAGGTRPLLGTNPMAFAWPRPGGLPFIFDFATSAAARGEVELRRRAGESLPSGWAVDPAGAPTTDPAQALAGALLPFGGHKGFALSMMVELIAGPLIGDLTSREAYGVDNHDGGPPLGGELIVAIDHQAFGASSALAAAEAIFAEAKAQPDVRLPSERRYAERARTRREGVELPRALFEELTALRQPRI